MIEPDLLWPLLAGTGAAVAFALMARNLRRARLIEDIPTSKIRSAAQGYLELNGFARTGADGPLEAPLTRTPCVWYRYRIEQRELAGHNRWRTVKSGASEQPFLLDDSTGQCLVDPRGADITPGRQRQWVDGRNRYTEALLRADDWLYLVGWFESLHPPNASAQAQTLSRQLLREWKADQPALLARFDANGDNVIDSAEWEAARTSATTQAHRHVLKHYDPTPQHILKRPTQRRHPYLIANRDPKRLASRYRWQARLSLLAGVLLTIYCGGALVMA